MKEGARIHAMVRGKSARAQGRRSGPLREQSSSAGVRIAVTTPDGEEFPDLARASDGLAGDLIAWTEAYSKQRIKTFPEARIEVPNLDDL